MYNPIEVKSIKTIHDNILVADMNFDERTTQSGIILTGDDQKMHGIHARWGKVYAVGPDQSDVKVGQWVCIAHGRWTRGVDILDPNGKVTIRRVDNNDILLVSDEQPIDESIGNSL